MRWMCIMAVLALGLSKHGAARAADDTTPSPGDVAAWIRSGGATELDRAADAAAHLDAEALRQVIQEVRDQTRVHAHLERKRVKGLVWDGVGLDTAVSYLRTITGVSFFVTPRARTELSTTTTIHLEVRDVTIRTVLDMLTSAHALAWRVRGGIVQIGTADEVAPAPPQDPLEAAAREHVAACRVTVKMDEASLADCLKTLQIQTGLDIHLDTRVAGAVAAVVVRDLTLEDVPLAEVLDMLVAQSGDTPLIWTVHSNVIVLTTAALQEAR